MTTVSVKQFVSRKASTGREMYSIDILVGQLKLSTFWGDMPYQLPIPIIKRIKKLVIDMITNGWSIIIINHVLIDRYYSGFPKKQNCSDYERFVKSYNRYNNKPPRLDGYYTLSGKISTDRGAMSSTIHHYITRKISNVWVSSPVNCPDNSISILRVRKFIK